MKRILISMLLFFCGGFCFAQKFVAQSTLPAVSKNGFYRIALSPEISKYLTDDFGNVRIYDGDNREVPWLFQEEPLYYHTEQFRTYAIAQKKVVKNCCTTLILHNPAQTPINNISLNIRNADVRKNARLLGSDDRKQWYALLDHITISSIDNKSNTAELKIVNFPLSNYTYFSIELDDSTSAPLNILSAGYYERSWSDGQYAAVPVSSLNVSDSAKEKKTYIRVTFNAPQVVDKLHLIMEGMPYFQRAATLFELQQRDVKKGKEIVKESYYRHSANFQVRSSQPGEIILDQLKSKELLIVIENNDNPPLRVKQADVFQRNRYVTAWLEAGKAYSVRFGNDELKAPVYDIAFFKDSIPESPEVIRAAQVSTIALQAKTKTEEVFFDNVFAIWAVIIVVIVILGVLSIRLVREASKKQPE